MPFSKIFLVILISVMTLTACSSVGHNDILKASEDIQGSYINENNLSQSLYVTKWWETINDQTLNDNVTVLLNQNLALKEAGERIIQNNERIAQANSSFFPNLTASTTGSRSFQNTGAQGIAGDFGNARFYNTNYNPGLQSSWEIDLFGRIRNSTNAAQSSFIASQFDKEALTQSLIAQLVNIRINIETHKTLLEIAQEIAYNRSQVYDLVKRRYDLGLESIKLSTVYLAEDRMKTAQSEIYQYETLLSSSLYAYDILLGQKPGTTNHKSLNLDLNQNLPAVSTCLPAALIDMRPDLKAARARVNASGYNVKVAMADLYPSLNLSAALGFSGNETKNLFTAEQLAGSILGSLTSSIFQGGRIKSTIRIRESEAREISYNYAGQILEAISDVENFLKAKHNVTNEIIDIEQSIFALKRSEDLIYNRYIQGIETLQNVLDARQSLLIAQQRKTLKQQEKWHSHVGLILALGGNWFDNNNSCDKDNTLNPKEENSDEK